MPSPLSTHLSLGAQATFDGGRLRPVKAFVTGGTGFIGQRLVHALRERGDEVVALVRSRDRGRKLESMGAQLHEGDLSDQEALQSAMSGCDAVFHGAAIYKVGIPKSEHEEMYDANVRGTEHALDAAIGAGVPRIVYISTINVFGNTRGEVVDEGYERDTSGNGFLSYYDETKWRAHQVALDRVAKGAPIVIVQPGGVYGPGDHSEVATMIDQVRTGKLLALPFPDTGLNLVFVDDVAAGCLLAHDVGEIGQSYVLGGEIATMRKLVDKVAEIDGKKAPKRDMPTGVLKAVAPAGPVIGKIMGFPPNFRELISASDGVTYWARDDKARQQLGYSPRDLDTGLRQTLSTP
jgi:dihydroflavonol-4-reductase